MINVRNLFGLNFAKTSNNRSERQNKLFATPITHEVWCRLTGRTEGGGEGSDGEGEILLPPSPPYLRGLVLADRAE